MIAAASFDDLVCHCQNNVEVLNEPLKSFVFFEKQPSDWFPVVTVCVVESLCFRTDVEGITVNHDSHHEQMTPGV